MDGGGNHHVGSATDGRLRQAEGLQVALGEGPCLTACEIDRYVAVAHRACDDLSPCFSADASVVGSGAVFSFPPRHAGVAVSGTPGGGSWTV